jgi:hypothetical protein
MMNKIQKAIKAIVAIVRQPALLNLVLDSDEVFGKQLERSHGIKRLPAIDLLDLFPGFSEEVKPYSFLEGGSLPIDLALLKGLARRYTACSYFEIGSWRGESIANVAGVAETCYSLNLSSEEMTGMGWDKKYIDLHDHYSRNLKNVVHLKHNSLTFDYSPYVKKMDLVFVDGDHHYESVKTDTENAFKLLKNDNSVIVWHDYGSSPERVRADVLSGILDGCPAHERGHVYHVSNTLCAIYIKGNWKKKDIVYPMVPDKTFSVKISAERI